jgi:glyoxylate/hydroxypyruvate reductase A
VLDVFRQEPLPADHPFWTDSRITITPHTAARTLFQETLAQISGKVRALERGEAINGVVDLKRGY